MFADGEPTETPGGSRIIHFSTFDTSTFKGGIKRGSLYTPLKVEVSKVDYSSKAKSSNVHLGRLSLYKFKNLFGHFPEF